MISYVQGAEQPPIHLRLPDSYGVLIDLSAGWTFTVKIGRPGAAALLTKTTGVSAPAPPWDADDPNLIVTWAVGDLASLSVGVHTLQIQARNPSTQDRIWQLDLQIKHPVT